MAQTAKGKSSDRRILDNDKKWAEIQKRRAEMRQKTLKRRIALIGGLVLALVVGVVVVMSLTKSNSASSSQDKQLSGATIQAQGNKVDDLEGFLIGEGGFGKANLKVPNVELYFSYTCPGCIQLENQYGAELVKLAKAGKINLLLHPVNVHTFQWTIISSDAAILVAKEQPDKLIDFHTAIFKAGYDIMFKDQAAIAAQGNGTIMQDEKAALAEIKKVALSVGVDQKLVDQFKFDASAKTIDKWTEDWSKQVQKKLSGKSPATPMIVHNGKLVETEKLVVNGKIDWNVLAKSSL